MRILFAIAKQTLRGCIRSKVVIALLALNVLAVVGIPLTVKGDGTAIGELQVSLIYSLRAVTTLLSLAAMWVGCSGLSREIESYNMHLVLTKPAPRWLVWLGKWLGVFSMSAGVYVFSSVLLFGLIIYRFNTGDFSKEEQAKARQEVLVGRHVYRPQTPDFDEIAGEEYKRRLAAGEFAEGHDPRVVIAELSRQVKARSTGVATGQAKGWEFNRISRSRKQKQVFVRYRLYVGSKSISKQRDTVGRWLILNPDADNPQQRMVSTPMMRVRSGVFQEWSFPADMLSQRGTAVLLYENFDPKGESVIFQIDDGPSLLLRTTGFSENWMRGTLVGVMRLGLLAALGCTFGALFSTPVSIFVAIAYLLLSAILNPELGMPNRDFAGNIVSWRIKDMISFSASQLVRLVVVSFRDFDVTHSLARGYLIGNRTIAKLAAFEFTLRGLPMAALGIWVFARREIGRVIRR